LVDSSHVPNQKTTNGLCATLMFSMAHLTIGECIPAPLLVYIRRNDLNQSGIIELMYLPYMYLPYYQ
jgi:hypothetical protein